MSQGKRGSGGYREQEGEEEYRAGVDRGGGLREKGTRKGGTGWAGALATLRLGVREGLVGVQGKGL